MGKREETMGCGSELDGSRTIATKLPVLAATAGDPAAFEWELRVVPPVFGEVCQKSIGFSKLQLAARFPLSNPHWYCLEGVKAWALPRKGSTPRRG
jgi:hypothetical protein